MSIQDVRRTIPLIMAVLMIATAFIPAVSAASTTKIVSSADSRDTVEGIGLPPVPPGFSVPLRQDDVNAAGTGYIPSKTRTTVQNESSHHLPPDERITGIHRVVTDTGKIKDYDPAEKTITIKGSGRQAGEDGETEIKIRLVNATPDLGTFTEIFEIIVPRDTVLDASEDFLATWKVCAGKEEVTGAEWFVWEDRIHTIEIPITEYRDVIIEEAIPACDDVTRIPDGEVTPAMEIRNATTGENESPISYDGTVTPRTIETSGFADQDLAADGNTVFREPYIARTEIREESWPEWVSFDPAGQTLHAGETKLYKIVYTKPAEPGRVEIRTAPVFRGVECPEMTWWSTAWTYRVPVTIANPPSIDGYPHREVVSFRDGMQADFDDIRFATDDGIVLDYWKETYMASDSVVIWVNLPAGATSIWMYYGNAAATDTGSRDNAYILYDDFNGPDLDTTLWTDTTPGAHYFSNGWIYDARSQGAGALVSNEYVIADGEPVIVETHIHADSLPYNPGYACGFFPWFIDTANNALFWYPESSSWDRYVLINNAAAWRPGTSRGLSTGGDYYSTWIITPISQTHAVSGSASYTDVFSGTTGITNHRMQILGGDNVPTGRIMRMDWIRVRKYVETEPTFTYGTPEIYRALTTIDVDLERSTLVEGETCTLNATAYDQFGEAMNDVVFTWASGNETVGTVSEDLVFTAWNNGSTEVYAMNNSIYGSETALVTYTSNTLILYEGWNVISFPLALENNTWQAVTHSGDGLDYAVAYAWDTTTQRWVQMIATSKINPLDAVYILMNDYDRLSVAISPEITNPPTRALKAGWNLVGFYGLSPECARDTLISLRYAWATAQGFDAGTQELEVSMVNGGTGSNSDQRLMFPGKGYWVFMTEEATLIPLKATKDSHDEDYPQVGVEWVDNYDFNWQNPLSQSSNTSRGFYSTLVEEGGWIPMFEYGDHEVKGDHFFVNGSDQQYIDGVDVALFAGHGWSQWLVLSGVLEVMPYINCNWGDYDLEWIFLHGCHTTEDPDIFKMSMPYRTMNGVHLICGFATEGWDMNDGENLADRLLDGETVKQAWFDAIDMTHDPPIVLRVIGENGACENDHIWGSGTVISDPPVDYTSEKWIFNCTRYE